MDPQARENLALKSREVLAALEGIPSTAQYRKDTEAIMTSFIKHCKDANMSDAQASWTGTLR